MAQRALWLPWRRERSADPAPTTTADPAASNGTGSAAELRARREEIARMEERALRETESLAIQRADVDRRTQAVEDRERNLTKELEELKQSKRVQRRELERLSGLSAAQAKQLPGSRSALGTGAGGLANGDLGAEGAAHEANAMRTRKGELPARRPKNIDRLTLAWDRRTAGPIAARRRRSKRASGPLHDAVEYVCI